MGVRESLFKPMAAVVLRCAPGVPAMIGAPSGDAAAEEQSAGAALQEKPRTNGSPVPRGPTQCDGRDPSLCAPLVAVCDMVVRDVSASQTPAGVQCAAVAAPVPVQVAAAASQPKATPI